MLLRYLLLLCCLLPATGSPARAGQVSQPLSAHEQGRKIYNFRCYYCHGYSGDAKTLSSTFLSPKPRDFTRLSLDSISREAMIETVRNGRANTGMAGFAGIISDQEIALVVDFVRHEFIEKGRENTRYHTRENGWNNHQRYRDAFPFATGEIPLDTPWEQLDKRQQRGKRLFLDTCVSCHDRARVVDEGPVWEPSAVSYPRNNTSFTTPPDNISSASVYAKHDVRPRVALQSTMEKRGEGLYQENCAFCHAADGTGRNWIGSFLEPRPRDLTNPAFMLGMSRQRLRHVIENGLKDTSMPAWKNVLEPQDIEAIMAYINRAFHPLVSAADPSDNRKVLPNPVELQHQKIQ